MNEKLTVLIDHDTVVHRIAELAKQISADYRTCCTAQNPLLVLCTLRGAVFFASDLIRQLDIPCELDFVKIHSYRGTRPAEIPVFDLGENLSVEGRHVLIVEDIVDTGHTIETMLKQFGRQQAESVRVCTLLDKPSRREAAEVIPDYVCFEIEDLFVVGWGLDYNEQYRLLPDVMVYHPEA